MLALSHTSLLFSFLFLLACLEFRHERIFKFDINPFSKGVMGVGDGLIH